MQNQARVNNAKALLLALFLSATPLAHAHLMVAQHGTLNFVGGAAYMVLSLPISAFPGIDDDKDGNVSMVEFNRHRSEIFEAVRRNIALSSRHGAHPLHGILLSPVQNHHDAQAHLEQLTVMGRFDLADGDTSALRFHVGLFGTEAPEHTLRIAAKCRQQGREHSFQLTSQQQSATVFPTLVQL